MRLIFRLAREGDSDSGALGVKSIAQELRIMGSKGELLRTLVAASSTKTAGFGVRSSVPKWRPVRDSNPCYQRERQKTIKINALAVKLAVLCRYLR